MATEEVEDSTQSSDRRVIKRYSNRKLYDTRDSRYVTLLQIAEMVRAGEDVQIIDNASKEDKTDVTLALIISEELKARPRGIPLSTLKALIRLRSEKLLTTLRDGPIGKLIPRDDDDEHGAAAEEDEMGQAKDPNRDLQGKGIRATLEQWQHAIDERIRAVLPNYSAFRELQAEVRRLGERLDELEKKNPQSPGPQSPQNSGPQE
jgi:polyhydroxyalkanoate synthesis repressor PhaR